MEIRGYPTTIRISYINFHPFSWTKLGYGRTQNFKKLISERMRKWLIRLIEKQKTSSEELLSECSIYTI